jgi:hypothetical protein
MPEGEFQADPPIRPHVPEHQALPRAARVDQEIDIRQPDSPVSTLIPYKNPKALIAYYCGVFALIPCLGAVLGPIALTLGILGIQFVNKNPTAKGTGHAITGIVLGVLTTLGNWGMILVTAIGIVAGAASHR